MRDLGIDLGIFAESRRGLCGYAFVVTADGNLDYFQDKKASKDQVADIAIETESNDAELMTTLLAIERASAEVMRTSVFFKGTEQEQAKWFDGSAQEAGAEGVF